jgi:transketolase
MVIATVATREVFGRTLVELGKENPHIVVLGGDLNKSTTALAFGQQFPDRFFDLGAAEQNMMAMAGGFAISGKVPICNTFAVFGTGRPFDQIRMSIAQPHLNVKIVVTHAGLLTGDDGMSAQSVEDLALMTSLIGFTVVVPSDAPEAEAAIRAAVAVEGPFYIRLSRPAIPVLHDPGFLFELGKAEVMREGTDVTLVAYGIMVSKSLEAAEVLAGQGVNARVLNMATLAPVDEAALLRAAEETGALVTAEEHYVRGGLNAVVSQVITANAAVPVEAVALHSYGESGQPEQLLEKYGLTTANVVAAAQRAISRKR